MITLTLFDWIIIVGYCLLAVGMGVFLSGRATKNMDEYFVAGRSFPWWVAGTSMIATSFAADTPLALTRIVRTQGLQGNWYWWCGVMGFLFCACVFARMWQRGRFITDAEIYELRYEGKPAKVLRAYNALHRSIFLNCITMGWVMLAMIKIMGVLFNIPSIAVLSGGGFDLIPDGQTLADIGLTQEQVWFVIEERIIGVVICIVIALVYATLAGMWGVAATDMVQFVIAMIGSVSLAVVSVNKLGGFKSMREKVTTAIDEYSPTLEEGGYAPLYPSDSILNFLPDLSVGWLAVATFIIYITVMWWGGCEGGGFLAQRLFCCKDERHGMLAMLWFSFGHFVLRFWPWMIVGFASIAFFPEVKDAEEAYPMMINFLPIGLKGLMVASLLAAFMSTIDTHLNWGGSYLVNDVYKRFLKKDGDAKHYVRVGQICNFLLMVLVGITAYYMNSILSAWLYLAEIGAGLVLAILLRWFWWRVNAWSEISAMVSSLVLANSFRVIGKAFDIPLLAADEWFAVRLVVILALCTLVWVTVTFLTAPVSQEQLTRFYERINPPGWWGAIRENAKADLPVLHLPPLLGMWALGVASIYCFLIGTGKIIFEDGYIGWICCFFGVIFGALTVQSAGKNSGMEPKKESKSS